MDDPQTLQAIAEEALDALRKAGFEHAQASAQAGLQTAQAKLAQLQAGPTQADLEAAKSGIAAAQAGLATKSGNTKPSDVALQQEAVRQADSGDSLLIDGPFA